MLRLSVNLLSNVYAFLCDVKENDCNSVINSFAYYHSFSVNTDTMMELAGICNWVVFKNNNPYITERGIEIIRHGHYDFSPECIRLMLVDYIVKVKPIWSGRIPAGRKEACIIMTKDERACFLEAGLLMESPTQDVVDWWDKLASCIRQDSATANNVTGRKGEKLTISYEHKRTQKEPQWIAIESNLLGFDIISQQSESDHSKLLIEVKSSTEPINNALLYISKNEWDIASSSKRYLFYLWLLSPHHNQLAIISPSIMAEYIPINQQFGKWENVSIPYNVFSQYFLYIEE